MLTSNNHAAFIDITIDYNKNSECKFDKLILKNEVYNYKEFTAEQIKENKNKTINIKAYKSKQLKITGTSGSTSLNISNGDVCAAPI